MREAPFRFFCLQAGDGESGPAPASIPQRLVQEKLGEALTSGPAVIVVRGEDLPAVFDALGDRAVDRGTKHPRVSLGRLAKNRDGILVIRGSYTSAGQMLRSVKKLLIHAIRRSAGSGCVVGVAGPLFEEMWLRDDVRGGAARRGLSGLPPEVRAGRIRALDWLPHDAEPEDLVRRLPGTSPLIRDVRRRIVLAARTGQAMLILGDNGTGKKAAARAIHDLRGGTGQFAYVNCIALADGRFEADLFGEVQQTGKRGRPKPVSGLWDGAGEDGTLYLDEVSALRPDQQALLNVALSTGEFRLPGGRIKKLPSVQVILSSACALGSLVRTGGFLADLFYRVRGFTITTPLLRDRPEDIPALARSLWRKLAGEEAQPPPESVLAALQPYPWPGNVRELKSVLSSLHALYGCGKLRPEHVAVLLAGQGFPAPPDTAHDRKPEQEGERMRTVRQLLRAEDIARSLQHLLIPAGGKRRALPRELPGEPAIEAVGRLLDELELLFFSPTLFGNIEAYNQANALKGKAHYFLSLLTSDRSGAAQFLASDLADALDTAIPALRAEISRLLE